MHPSFFDEMGKIAAAPSSRGPSYRTAIAAHEMGHAKDYETSKMPRLRTAGRALGPLAGLVGGAVLSAKDHPYLGAGAALAGFTPMLADEAIASHNAMKAMRASGQLSEAEIKKARGLLLRAGGTYLTSAAGATGAAVALGKGKGDLAHLSTLAGGLAGLGLATSMVVGLEKTPKSKKEALEKIRKQMKIKAQIYEAKEQPGQGGRWSELGAFYMPATKSKWMRALNEQHIGSMVKGDAKKLKRLQTEGGVVLPRTKV